MTGDPTTGPATGLRWLTSTLASDAAGGRGVLPEWIRPLRPGAWAAGYACTVAIGTDDNRFMPLAIERGPLAGRILVAGGGARSRGSCLGGLTGLQMVVEGFEAFVTDGLVRDAAELGRLPLGVWSRGVTPTASAKLGPGSVGAAVSCGGVLVHEGDLVVADDDGAVVWPRADVEQLLVRARQRLDADTARQEELERRLTQARAGIAPGA